MFRFDTIRFALDTVSDYAAYLAAASRGSASAGVFLQQFNDDMADLLSMQAHSRQYQGNRRQGYNRSTRRGNTWLGTTV